MNPRQITAWIFGVAAVGAGLVMLSQGFLRKEDGTRFSIYQFMFRTRSMSRSSKKQIIGEGFIALAIGITLILAFG